MMLLSEDQAGVHVLTAGASAMFAPEGEQARLAVPLVCRRRNTVRPVADDLDLKVGDAVYFALDEARRDEAISWLRDLGWHSSEQNLSG